MIKRFTMLAATAALALAIGSGAMAQDAPRIVVVVHGQATDPFWSTVKSGVDEAQKTFGATVEYRAPDTFDMVQMSQLIDAAVASQPDGLVVSVPDAAALGDAIKNAVASGIPVVSMNSGSAARETLGVMAHIGQTELEAGRGAGKKMKEAGVTDALCVNQEVGNVALDERCEGFTQGLGGKVEVVAVGMDPTEIQSAVKAQLAAKPSVNGVLALGPVASEPTFAALKELDVLDKVKVATFDLSPGVLEAVRDGKMLFAIDQQPFLQGYVPVELLTLYKKYGLMLPGNVSTGPNFVTKDNAAQVIDLSAKGIR